MEEKQNCREGIRSTLWIGIEEQQRKKRSLRKKAEIEKDSIFLFIS